MADNTYRLKLQLSDGSQVNAGTFTAPQGPKGDKGDAGAQGPKGDTGQVDYSRLNGKLDKLTYEWNKGINFGSSGKLYVGRFKLYDSNLTVEFSCTTTETYSGKLVIAAQNGNILKVNVYGDAANTLASRIFVKGEGVGAESANRQWVQVYFNPPAWSKNILHICAQAIDACDETVLCTNISAVPSDYTNTAVNVLTDKFAPKSHTHDVATQSKNGLMSAADKVKLDGLGGSDAVTVTFAAGQWVQNGTGFKLTIPQSSHKQTQGLFACRLRHLTDGVYKTNTWAVLGTDSAYDAATGNIVLTGSDAYDGAAVIG